LFIRVRWVHLGLFESGRENYPAAASPADFALRQNQTATDPERITIAITKKHSLKHSHDYFVLVA
jgi:hypothetical protein